MIRRNMVCYLSELGHRNFYYPTKTKAVVTEHCQDDIEILNWLGGASRNLKAVKVKNECLYPLTLNEDAVKEILSKNKEEYSIVWIEK